MQRAPKAPGQGGGGSCPLLVQPLSRAAAPDTCSITAHASSLQVKKMLTAETPNKRTASF